MQLAYLGPRGTFTEEAARTYCARDPRRQDWELVPVRGIPELLYAVDRGVYPLGIVPVENSIEGSVVVTLDLLVHEVDLQIVGEEVLSVRHHLLARPETPLEAVRRVISHPQALAQCRHTLSRLLPGVEMQAATSTAEAAELVAGAAGLPWAAIGTPIAAELYGLRTLAADIHDVAENATRFLVVGHERPAPSGADKTSIVFAFEEDKPGNLHGALGAFAHRGVNLTKLESRPAKRSLGDYIFFADMEGHQDDPVIADALAEVRSRCAFFRVLGSYPRAAVNARGADGAKSIR